VFGKRYDNVMRDIRELMETEDHSVLNFEETRYLHPQNMQHYHCYEMTRDAYLFLSILIMCVSVCNIRIIDWFQWRA